MQLLDFDINNRMTEDDAIEQAYDIFLQLATDNLDAADIMIFNLTFEQRGIAESYTPTEDWFEYVDEPIHPDFYTEIVIGLLDDSDEIDKIFARILLCLDKNHKFCHIRWAN
jgi:uncharacterized protein YciU (UPF0263 family)